MLEKGMSRRQTGQNVTHAHSSRSVRTSHSVRVPFICHSVHMPPRPTPFHFPTPPRSVSPRLVHLPTLPRLALPHLTTSLPISTARLPHDFLREEDFGRSESRRDFDYFHLASRLGRLVAGVGCRWQWDGLRWVWIGATPCAGDHTPSLRWLHVPWRTSDLRLGEVQRGQSHNRWRIDQCRPARPRKGAHRSQEWAGAHPLP